ncbi:hypothetical protein HPP92_025560 [Vanilla planifolia]|nr:hypothetical protein HPP92_025560 [Vanilla planifolia]
MDSSAVSCNSSLLGLPVIALSSVLSSRQIQSSDVLNGMIISQLLKFAKTVICGYRNAGEVIKEDYAKLLGSILELFSNLRHLYGLDEFGEFILELQRLFMVPDATLSQYCHHSTANFLASLCHMQLPEDAGNPLYNAIWDLYHLLLRERHWAFVHLAISAFGYFAARTSCTQLWRFVPSDAALSFDVSTGNEAKYDSFMAELKVFLEKEAALRDASTCKEQLSHLFKDGMVLDRLMKASRGINDAPGAQTTKSGIPHICLSKKKRKPPEGICTGMELLQNGLQVMNNALWEDEYLEIKREFSTHISCLQGVLSQLFILYNTMWDA